jgi:Adenylyl/Guanylyl and SMODS C-terminal sensor domain/Cyclic GMP-AMP synthase DncV-like, nucleotidyltransferase domain
MAEPLPRIQQASLLDVLARDLDIPPGKYREAVSRYEAVGRWLDAPDSPLHSFSPQIYPQGSFRLGTVVRPVNSGQEADYDIDLVCQLGLHMSEVSPRALKNMIGDRLKAHATYCRLLEVEGRRCWTLRYAETDGVGFHLDALPAVSDSREAILLLETRSVSLDRALTAIQITEKDQTTLRYSWLPGGSNPRGYATWFDTINQPAFLRESLQQKQRLYEQNRRVFASVADVPDALVRTPLQRVVQIFKRHRDVRFIGHEWEDERPISVILTTLAARGYAGELTTLDALESILSQIENYSMSQIISHEGGIWRVPNPVNPEENFADRWNDPGSHRADAFLEWLRWLRQDLALLELAETPEEAQAHLREAFSPPRSSTAPPVTGSVVSVSDRVPGLGDTSHRQAPLWPVRRLNRVTVQGSVRASQHAMKELWALSGRSIPKGKWIRFQAQTNARPPYEVKWQVVNTGKEASERGIAELRGHFDEGTGQHGTIQWEHTAYRGTHSIEAFVIKDGVCVARSGPVTVRVR